jgi:hypothetical protein
VYREFSRRHLFAGYKVHELIRARLKHEKQKQDIACSNLKLADTVRGRFFNWLRCEIIPLFLRRWRGS